MPYKPLKTSVFVTQFCITRQWDLEPGVVTSSHLHPVLDSSFLKPFLNLPGHKWIPRQHIYF